MRYEEEKSKLPALLMLLFGRLFLFSAFMSLRIIVNGQMKQWVFDELAESITAALKGESSTSVPNSDSEQPVEPENSETPSPYEAL